MTDKLWDGVREGCGTCEFGNLMKSWTGSTGVVIQPVECRRHPPQMVSVTEKNPWGDLSHDVRQFTPTMSESDWCGEYKRKGAA